MNRSTSARATILTLLVLAGTSGLPALAGKVVVDYDREFDFSLCRTFAWGAGGAPDGNELNQRRIERAVADELAARGLAEAPAADLIVETEVVVDRRRRSGPHVGVGIGRRTGWGGVSVGGSAPVGSRTVRHSSLVIRLIDADTNDTVWEAWADRALHGSPGKLEKRIRKAVAKAFRKYPD